MLKGSDNDSLLSLLMNLTIAFVHTEKENIQCPGQGLQRYQMRCSNAMPFNMTVVQRDWSKFHTQLSIVKWQNNHMKANVNTKYSHEIKYNLPWPHRVSLPGWVSATYMQGQVPPRPTFGDWHLNGAISWIWRHYVASDILSTH